MSYWLHPEAEAELGNSAVYYAEHANRSIASAFVTEFERVDLRQPVEAPVVVWVIALEGMTVSFIQALCARGRQQYR